MIQQHVSLRANVQHAQPFSSTLHALFNSLAGGTILGLFKPNQVSCLLLSTYTHPHPPNTIGYAFYHSHPIRDTSLYHHHPTNPKIPMKSHYTSTSATYVYVKDKGIIMQTINVFGAILLESLMEVLLYLR